VPWKFIDNRQLQIWFDHCDNLKELLGDKVDKYRWESIDYIKNTFKYHEKE